MGQIVGTKSNIFRCNLAAIQSGGSKANTILAADEVWLVDTTNSLTNSLSGNCDAYIVGDGTFAAGALELHRINKDDYVFTELDGEREDAHLSLVSSNGVITKVEIVQKKLTDVIWEGKTYLDIFEKNNWILYYNNTNNCGFDNNSYSPAASYQGSPTIVSTEYDTPPYSLKCFGTSNTRLRDGLGSVTGTLFMAARLKCTRYSAGNLGVSCSGYSSRAAQVGYVTNGWVTKTKIYTASAEYVYIGSFNTANLDGYIDSPVVVKMSIFTNAPSLEQMTEWYEEYIALKKKNGVSVEIPTKDYVDNNFATEDEVSEADATIIEQVEQSVKKVISDSVTIEEYLNGNLEQNIINADGSTVTSSGMRHVAISNLTEGLVLTLRNYYISSGGSKVYGGQSTKIYAVCAKNGDTIVPSKGRAYNANLSQYVVPADIDNVILTISNETSYTHREILRTEVDAITTYYKQQILDGAPLQWSGSLNAGEIKYLPVENVSLGKIFVFTAHISTFGALTFGRLNSAGNGLITPKVEVNETSVVCYSNTSSSFNTSFEHGLTIANDIQVIVQVGEEVKIVVQSNGSRWQTTTTRNRNGEYANSLAVTTDTGIFTDCVLSESLQNIRKDTWVFGDSWVSLYEQRWTYQAIHLGYSNWFLNGFAGATSLQGFNAFQTLVGVHIPKTLLWLYGMNDIDTNDSTPNPDWLSVVEQVENICENNNIELILATIPTTPTRNMNAKNAYVRASGHRYVDQAAAMGADTSGNWFSGYSSEDGNHTTTQGAIALMGRFFCDVPELMYNE